MAKWVLAGNTGDFERSCVFTHKRKEYALFKLSDGVYCLNNVCSHEYSPLGEGIIIDGDVCCPKHGSRFEIRTGAVKDLPATSPVKRYPVKVEENGDIYIEV